MERPLPKMTVKFRSRHLGQGEFVIILIPFNALIISAHYKELDMKHANNTGNLKNQLNRNFAEVIHV